MQIMSSTNKKNGNYYFEANFILGRSFKKDQIVRIYEDSWQIKIKQQIRKSLCKHFLNANFRFIDHLIDVWWGHICFRKIFIYKKFCLAKRRKMLFLIAEKRSSINRKWIVNHLSITVLETKPLIKYGAIVKWYLL